LFKWLAAFQLTLSSNCVEQCYLLRYTRRHPIPPNNNTPNLAQIERTCLDHEEASSNALQVMCRQQWRTLLPLSLYKVALYSPWSLHWMEEQFGTQLNPPRLHTLEISLDPLAAVTLPTGKSPSPMDFPRRHLILSEPKNMCSSLSHTDPTAFPVSTPSIWQDPIPTHS
jgi:hypothetical protein